MIYYFMKEMCFHSEKNVHSKQRKRLSIWQSKKMKTSYCRRVCTMRNDFSVFLFISLFVRFAFAFLLESSICFWLAVISQLVLGVYFWRMTNPINIFKLNSIYFLFHLFMLAVDFHCCRCFFLFPQFSDFRGKRNEPF